MLINFIGIYLLYNTEKNLDTIRNYEELIIRFCISIMIMITDFSVKETLIILIAYFPYIVYQHDTYKNKYRLYLDIIVVYLIIVYTILYSL